MKRRPPVTAPPSALTGAQLIALTAAIIEADPGPDADKARAFAKTLREGVIDKSGPKQW